MENVGDADAWAITDCSYGPRAVKFIFKWVVKKPNVSRQYGKFEIRSPEFSIPDFSKSSMYLLIEFPKQVPLDYIIMDGGEKVHVKDLFTVTFVQYDIYLSPFAATLEVFSGERKMIGMLGNPKEKKYVIGMRNLIPNVKEYVPVSVQENILKGSFYMLEPEENLVLKLNLVGRLKENEHCQGSKVIPEPLMKNLLNNPKYSDVILKCGATSFSCHRNILAAMSTVFDSMFQVDMVEKIEGEVDITDIKPEIMKTVLEFIYTGKTGEEEDTDLASLIYAAYKYELPGLMMICQEKMKRNLNQDNVLEILLLADRHGVNEVKKMAMENISRNKKTYLNSEAFCEQMNECPQKLLLEMLKK